MATVFSNHVGRGAVPIMNLKEVKVAVGAALQVKERKSNVQDLKKRKHRICHTFVIPVIFEISVSAYMFSDIRDMKTFHRTYNAEIDALGDLDMVSLRSLSSRARFDFIVHNTVLQHGEAPDIGVPGYKFIHSYLSSNEAVM